MNRFRFRTIRTAKAYQKKWDIQEQIKVKEAEIETLKEKLILTDKFIDKQESLIQQREDDKDFKKQFTQTKG